MVSLKAARKEPGVSMPGGRYPIRNAGDLANAKRAIGRTPPSGRPAVERHIQARAKAIGGSGAGAGRKWLSEG